MKPLYTQHNECAEKDIQFVEYKNIPSDDNCLFASLLMLINNSMTIDTFKRSLLRSAAIKLCSDKIEVEKILSTPKAWGNSEVLFVFSETYDTNVCVHIYNSEDKRVNYAHYKANERKEFIHLKLKNAHFTPLLPANLNDKNMINYILECSDDNFDFDKVENFSDKRETPEYTPQPEEIPPKPPDKSRNPLPPLSKFFGTNKFNFHC